MDHFGQLVGTLVGLVALVVAVVHRVALHLEGVGVEDMCLQPKMISSSYMIGQLEHGLDQSWMRACSALMTLLEEEVVVERWSCKVGESVGPFGKCVIDSPVVASFGCGLFLFCVGVACLCS